MHGLKHQVPRHGGKRAGRKVELVSEGNMIPQEHEGKRDMARAACALAQLGWPVFRVRPFGKRPLCAGWQAEATTEPGILGRLWSQSPGANIGLACGPAFWALDVDGLEGRATLGRLQQRHGKLPATVTSRTGSGGYHLLFAPTPRVRNSVRRLGPGLDTRAAGGLIVAPPSIHPNGARYRWLPAREPWAIPLAEAPRWLLDLLDPPLPKGEGPLVLPPEVGDTYARAALRRAVERVGGAPLGRRNQTLNAEAFGLGQLAGAGLLPPETAALALASAALATGLDRGEVARTIASGLKAGLGNPRAKR